MLLCRLYVFLRYFSLSVCRIFDVDRPASSIKTATHPQQLHPKSSTQRLPTARGGGDFGQRSDAAEASSTTSPGSANCCPGCFGRPSFRTNRRLLKKRWLSDSGSACPMSEVYCKVCAQDDDEDAVEQGPQTEADAAATAVLCAVNENADSPACLATVPATSQCKKPATNLLNVESELELPGSGAKFKLCAAAPKKNAAAPSIEQLPQPDRHNNNNDHQCRTDSIEELEFGDDVSAGILNEAGNQQDSVSTPPLPTGVLDEAEVESRQLTRVHGSEELPVQHTTTNATCLAADSRHQQRIEDVQDDVSGVRLRRGKLGLPVLAKVASVAATGDDRNGNEHSRDNRAANRNYSTLPKMKRNVVHNEEVPSQEAKPSETLSNNIGNVSLVMVSHPNGSGVRRRVPMRTTPDGTNIYYWCDMSKRVNKGGHTVIDFLLILYIILSI